MGYVRLEAVHNPSFLYMYKSTYKPKQLNSHFREKSLAAANFCFPTELFRYRSKFQDRYQSESTKDVVTKSNLDKKRVSIDQDTSKLGITKILSIHMDNV